MRLLIKILKCELFRQLRNPLCIVYLILPFLSVAISLATVKERINMFEVVCGSYAAGILTMFMRDNMMAWLVISVILIAQNFRSSYNIFNSTLPASKVARWGAVTLSMWIISTIHWLIFFILFSVSSRALIGTSLILRIMILGSILVCGGIMILLCSIAQIIRNPILFTISFFIIFVFMSAISDFQNYNIFAYAIITPNLVSDTYATNTMFFLEFVLPIYYVITWVIGLMGFNHRI